MRAWRRKWKKIRQRWSAGTTTWRAADSGHRVRGAGPRTWAPSSTWWENGEGEEGRPPVIRGWLGPRQGWIRQTAVALAAFALLAAIYRLPLTEANPVKQVVAYVAGADYDPVVWYQSGRAQEVMSRYFSAETWKAILRGRKDTAPGTPASMTWPVSGQVTSGFGWRQVAGSGKEEFHEGLDISAPEGTPVLAAAAGTVKAVRQSPAYGKVLEIQHEGDQRVVTVYAHCAEILVAEKQRVQAGEQVAKVGKTGNAGAPHVHFEVRLDGKAVDPMIYLPPVSP